MKERCEFTWLFVDECAHCRAGGHILAAIVGDEPEGEEGE